MSDLATASSTSKLCGNSTHLLISKFTIFSSVVPPRLSSSLGQPFCLASPSLGSPLASGQASIESGMPSPSASGDGQPLRLGSGYLPGPSPGQRSSASATPSLSLSTNGQP